MYLRGNSMSTDDGRRTMDDGTDDGRRTTDDGRWMTHFKSFQSIDDSASPYSKKYCKKYFHYSVSNTKYLFKHHDSRVSTNVT